MDEYAMPEKFEATLQEQQGVGVVIAHGDLDLDSASALKGLIDQATTRYATAEGVVADLSRVEFMESVTLGVLVEQRDALRDSGKDLALVISTGEDEPEEHPVGRLLGLTGQASEFSIYDSRAVAVEEMATGS